MPKDNEKVEKPKSLRPTFEDTRVNLEKLRGLIDNLVDENRPLRKDERRDFLEVVDRGLMGLGKRTLVEGGLILKSSNLPGGVTIKNVEDLLRFMAYHDSKVDTDNEGVDHGIDELWKIARELVLKATSDVLEDAARMSPEKKVMSPTEAEKW